MCTGILVFNLQMYNKILIFGIFSEKKQAAKKISSLFFSGGGVVYELLHCVPAVIVDVGGGVFVFGLVVAGRVAERHGCQRDDVFRKRKTLANAVDALHVGVHAGPYGTEAEGVSGEKEIFSGGGNVLNP